MALIKKALDDHFIGSFGQESETARTEKDLLIVGGVYQGTPPAISDGEAARLQTNSQGAVLTAQSVNAYHGTATIATSESTMAGTVKVVLNGILKQLIWTTADMEDTDSTKLEINDEKGYEIFDSGTVAESTTFTLGTALQDYDRPLYGTTSFVFTAQGTQSANRNIVFYVKYT